MSVFEFEVSEQITFYELEVQGNRFNGLEFDNVVVEGLFLEPSISLTDISLIEESLGLSDDFVASHEPYCYLFESLGFSEDFVIPGRVINSFVSIITKPPVNPVRMYWVGVDVIHGPDTFFDEVSENLSFFSDTRVANIYVETLYESFFIDLELPYNQPVEVWVSTKLTSTDIINFRHDVSQEYFFNNVVLEQLYPFDDIFRCYGNVVSDQLRTHTSCFSAHGRTVEDGFDLAEACVSQWLGALSVEDAFKISETAIDEKYYLMIVEEIIGVIDDYSFNPAFIESVNSSIAISDTVFGEASFVRMVAESLALSCPCSYEYVIDNLVDDTFGVVPSVVASYIAKAAISDAISAIDSNETSVILNSLVLDSLVLYDYPND